MLSAERPAELKIDRIDHVVLTVADIDATIAFYVRVLGMDAVRFGGRRALAFGRQKIKLHRQGREFEPKSHRPTPASGDLCFISATPLAEVIAHLEACGVEILEGPVERTGATGKMLSVCFRDPDLNLIEVSNYVEAQPAACAGSISSVVTRRSSRRWVESSNGRARCMVARLSQITRSPGRQACR